MADAALTTAQAAIKTVLENVSGLNLHAFGYVPGGGAGFPFAFTEVVGTKELGQSHAWTETTLNVYVLFGSAAGGRDVQELRDDAMTGVSSVAAALRADETLDGSVLSSTVVEDQTRGIFREAGGYESWGVVWEMKLLTAA